MVNKNYHIPKNSDGSIDLSLWLNELQLSERDALLIRNACELAQLTAGDQKTRFGSTCLEHGLELANILAELKMDCESIAVAIIYTITKYTDLTIEDLELQLDPPLVTLLEGVLNLDVINLSNLQKEKQSSQQLDNIRKMLLAMVQDVRVVVIKLAERLAMMRTLRHYDKKFQAHIAKETMDIFAPLANRLGLHQIKWELEDRAFYYLEPDEYKSIARQFDERRIDREKRVDKIVGALKNMLKKASVEGTVYGRAKHIYSIKRKMTRKNLKLKNIYDAIAVRVLVPSIEDCYKALSLAHETWRPFEEEFDDYIHAPKPNGYQSIHTTLSDEDDKYFEIQIRTYEMHEKSEFGVAAHWVYKEGRSRESAYEQKIACLRQLLDWQKDLANEKVLPEEIEQGIFENRIYVFTPTDDIIDLPTNATPLDFAFHIHTQVGYRCRGAKVNGKIVPLTYTLKTGERVEVLTTKKGEPSRDWLQPHQGYLKTPSARAKVLQFFKRKDYERHVSEGRQLLEKELEKLRIKTPINFAELAGKLNFKATDLMFSAIGSGALNAAKASSLIEREAAEKLKIIEDESIIIKPQSKVTQHRQTISVDGVENILSKLAKCCKPIPGDPIIGYITQNQGITIHREDCKNLQHARHLNPNRIMDVSWNAGQEKSYPVDIEVLAYSTPGLIRDISTTLLNDEVRVINLVANMNQKSGQSYYLLTLEIANLELLNTIITKLKQIPNVNSVKRVHGEKLS